MTKNFTADQEMVRKVNKSIVLNTLRLHAPLSRADLAVRTGLNRSTVSNIINYLLQEGLILERELQEARIGRPGILLTLNPSGGAVIGVEIGVGLINVILTDFVANICWQERQDISSGTPQNEILLKAEELIAQAIQKAGSLGLRVFGVGVGLPGLVNIHDGRLIFAPNLQWKNVALKEHWSSQFGLPFFIENEANLAALGEFYFGAGKGTDHLVFLSSNVGLGGGIIVGGKLFQGGHGFGGEIGHIQRDPEGEPCGCGRRGCWETQVGPSAVLKRVRTAVQGQPDHILVDYCHGNWEKLTFENIVEAALQNDAVCQKALREVAISLGAGVADLVHIFNPDMVVIGGAFSLAKSILQPVIEQYVLDQTLSACRQGLRIVFSDQGLNACALGAVAVVLDDIIRETAIV